jgi:hypothetical protein
LHTMTGTRLLATLRSRQTNSARFACGLCPTVSSGWAPPCTALSLVNDRRVLPQLDR